MLDSITRFIYRIALIAVCVIFGVPILFAMAMLAVSQIYGAVLS